MIDRLRTTVDDRNGLVEIGKIAVYGNGSRPEILIDGVSDAGGVSIRVHDNGAGVPPEERDRIFGMFARGTAGAHQQGTGIGLAFCRRVAERHGGTLRVGGSHLGGAVFELRLPVARTSMMS